MAGGRRQGRSKTQGKGCMIVSTTRVFCYDRRPNVNLSGEKILHVKPAKIVVLSQFCKLCKSENQPLRCAASPRINSCGCAYLSTMFQRQDSAGTSDPCLRSRCC